MDPSGRKQIEDSRRRMQEMSDRGIKRSMEASERSIKLSKEAMEQNRKFMKQNRENLQRSMNSSETQRGRGISKEEFKKKEHVEYKPHPENEGHQTHLKDEGHQNFFLKLVIIIPLIVFIILLIFYVLYLVTGSSNNVIVYLEEMSGWIIFQISGLIIIVLGVLVKILLKDVKKFTGVLVAAMGIIVLLIGFSDFKLLMILNNGFTRTILSLIAIMGLVIAILYILSSKPLKKPINNLEDDEDKIIRV